MAWLGWFELQFESCGRRGEREEGGGDICRLAGRQRSREEQSTAAAGGAACGVPFDCLACKARRRGPAGRDRLQLSVPLGPTCAGPRDENPQRGVCRVRGFLI